VLLQVLDDGRLTDGQGRIVDFKNTIIVMTSNLGSVYITEPGLSEDEMRERVMAAVRGHFRPEFLNRVDELVIFRQLREADLLRIVDLQVTLVAKRLEDRRVSLVVTDAARRALAREGYDPLFGARPLKRLIQRRLLDPLALKLLAGDFSEGSEVTVDHDGHDFTFSSAIVGEVVNA
jgi:ATP-dependent Clp protease ATP-binding subunit ClpB